MMNNMAFAALLLLLGCTVPAVEQAPPASAQADRHDMAVGAIASGIEAKTVEQLLEAEQRLAAAGAKPMEDTCDLAAGWRAAAEKIAGHELPAQPVRGRVLGSAYKHAVLGEGEALALEQIFMAGRKAKVSVVASDSARLHLSISGHEGTPLCARTVAGEPQSCAWLPTWTSRYRIELRNQSGREARVYLVVN